MINGRWLVCCLVNTDTAVERITTLQHVISASQWTHCIAGARRQRHLLDDGISTKSSGVWRCDAAKDSLWRRLSRQTQPAVDGRYTRLVFTHRYLHSIRRWANQLLDPGTLRGRPRRLHQQVGSQLVICFCVANFVFMCVLCSFLVEFFHSFSYSFMIKTKLYVFGTLGGQRGWPQGFLETWLLKFMFYIVICMLHCLSQINIFFVFFFCHPTCSERVCFVCTSSSQSIWRGGGTDTPLPFVPFPFLPSPFSSLLFLLPLVPFLCPPLPLEAGPLNIDATIICSKCPPSAETRWVVALNMALAWLRHGCR